jgi:hypothetical protein
MRLKHFIPALLIPALIALADPSNGNGNAKGRTRGKKLGSYTLLIVGDFKGSGTISVSDTTLSATLELTYANGGKTTVTFKDLKLSNDHFSGSSPGSATGGAPSGEISMTGRVDLPSAMDDQMTDAQAYTGRVVAMLKDASGKSAALVAVQDEASRGRGPSGNGNGRGGG